MLVVVRVRPIAASTDVGVFEFNPVFAMLTGPRLRPICRSTNKHVIVRIGVLGGIVSRDLKWNAVIDLQLVGCERLLVYGTLRPISLHQCLAESFPQNCSTRELARSRRGRITEPVGGNTSLVIAFNPKHFHRDAILFHISNRPRWMIISVRVFEFLRGDESMLKYMSDDSSGALGGDGLALGDEFSGEISFFFVHSRRGETASMAGTPSSLAISGAEM